MTVKQKRFGIGSRLGESIAATLSGPAGEEAPNVELVLLDRIEPDPENPRRLGLNPRDPRAIDPEDPLREEKEERLARLEELAASICQLGVQQPIKVYRHGEGFRVAFGERRYLASRLAGKASIPAIIVGERPRYLRLVQFTENLHREDLTPWQRLENVRAIIEEYSRFGEVLDTSVHLGEVTGLGTSQAANYVVLLSAPADITVALQTGQVTSLKKAVEAARVEDPGARRALLEALARGETLEGVKAARQRVRFQAEEKGRARAPRRGRAATRVQLGATRNLAAVRQIVETLAEPGAYSDTDWSDYASVTRVFQRFLRDLEGRVGG